MAAVTLFGSSTEDETCSVFANPLLQTPVSKLRKVLRAASPQSLLLCPIAFQLNAPRLWHEISY
jgi:hypothetical protein